MKILCAAIVFLLVLTQSLARSAPQVERKPRKKGAFVIKRFVPQAEHPGKRSVRDSMFDAHVQPEQDQDACMWRCQDWCKNRCRNSHNEECLDGCLGIYGWCMRKCRNGDLDRPGGEEEEEEEEEE